MIQPATNRRNPITFIVIAEKLLSQSGWFPAATAVGRFTCTKSAALTVRRVS